MNLPTAPSDGSVRLEQKAAVDLTAALRKQTQAAADWWQFMSGRLDAIAQHATGTKSRLV